MTVKISGTKKAFSVDIGSPVTVITPDKEIIKNEKISAITRNYQDFINNEVKFAGKITVEAESRGNRKNLIILITESEDIKPLLGIDCPQEINWTVRKIESTTMTTDQSKKDKIIAKFDKLFKTNRTSKDIKIKIQLKPGHIPTKQKARPLPYLLQCNVEKEIDKLIQYGHLEKIQSGDEDFFAFLVVITVKIDKSLKSALDSKKSNDSCIKMRPHTPNMEELLNEISTKITKVQNEPLWISKIDLEYVRTRSSKTI